MVPTKFAALILLIENPSPESPVCTPVKNAPFPKMYDPETLPLTDIFDGNWVFNKLPYVFAKFKDVNALPFAEIFETIMDVGKRSLLRVPLTILDALTFEIPNASPAKFPETAETEIFTGSWEFNKLP